MMLKAIVKPKYWEKFIVYDDSRTSDVQVYFTIMWYKSTEE